MMHGRNERTLKDVADELRRPVAVDARFDARVMAAVRALPRHRFGALARLLRPRRVTVHPFASGLAAAALVAVALGVGHAIGAGSSPSTSDAAAARTARGPFGAEHPVQFVLVAPTARKVAVVGDFNDWDTAHAAFQAQHRGGGVWSVTAPVPEGHHRYAFIVDDSVWVADPAAPRSVDENYGVPNSTLVVGEAGT